MALCGRLRPAMRKAVVAAASAPFSLLTSAPGSSRALQLQHRTATPHAAPAPRIPGFCPPKAPRPGRSCAAESRARLQGEASNADGDALLELLEYQIVATSGGLARVSGDGRLQRRDAHRLRREDVFDCVDNLMITGMSAECQLPARNAFALETQQHNNNKHCAVGLLKSVRTPGIDQLCCAPVRCSALASAALQHLMAATRSQADLRCDAVLLALVLVDGQRRSRAVHAATCLCHCLQQGEGSANARRQACGTLPQEEGKWAQVRRLPHCSARGEYLLALAVCLIV